MRIAMASDHAGLELKKTITQLLENMGHEVEDFGTHTPQKRLICQTLSIPPLWPFLMANVSVEFSLMEWATVLQ
jgi:hypothetical protein